MLGCGVHQCAGVLRCGVYQCAGVCYACGVHQSVSQSKL